MVVADIVTLGFGVIGVSVLVARSHALLVPACAPVLAAAVVPDATLRTGLVFAMFTAFGVFAVFGLPSPLLSVVAAFSFVFTVLVFVFAVVFAFVFTVVLVFLAVAVLVTLVLYTFLLLVCLQGRLERSRVAVFAVVLGFLAVVFFATLVLYTFLLLIFL